VKRIRTFRELAETVRSDEKKTRIAVVAANDAHTIEAVAIARRDGLAEPVLIGNRDGIRAELAAQDADPSDFEIVHADSIGDCLSEAMRIIGAGGVDVLMKGHLETGDFMSATLDRKNGLRRSDLLSVTAFYEAERYHKLLAVSDQGINMYPDFECKR
jgi:phosphate butyryltransferase